MNSASAMTISKMVKQAIFLNSTVKQEVVAHMGGKSSPHRLKLPEREVLSKWLIDKLGGTLYVLFDSRGFGHMVGGRYHMDAVGYLKFVEPKKEIVAWQVADNSKSFLELFKGAIPFTNTDKYLAAYKLAFDRRNDDEEDEPPAGATIQVGTNGNVAGFGLVMCSQADVRAMEFLGETIHTLHDAHLLSSMQHVGGEKLPEGTPVWIVKRGQPALPTPTQHPLTQVSPLPDAWGR